MTRSNSTYATVPETALERRFRTLSEPLRLDGVDALIELERERRQALMALAQLEFQQRRDTYETRSLLDPGGFCVPCTPRAVELNQYERVWWAVRFGGTERCLRCPLTETLATLRLTHMMLVEMIHPERVRRYGPLAVPWKADPQPRYWARERGEW